MNLDRMITTDMSAHIVADLLRRRWSIKRIARTIDAPLEFVHGVQAKKQVFTLQDVERIADAVGETAPLILFNSITKVPEHLQPLFDSTRQMLESSRRFENSLKRKSPSRRKSGINAA
jgi:hypothetical protein